MEFGSDLLYAPGEEEVEHDYIEESQFNHTVTGYSSVSADYKDDGERCLLRIFDPVIHEWFPQMRDPYVRRADCFLIVYSITDQSSFYEAQAIYDQTIRLREENLPVVICGNKCDLEVERQVSRMEGIRYAESIGVPFFEISAKMNINVSEAIHELIRRTPQLSGKEYQLVIFGAHGVGKSCICMQFVWHHIMEYDDTTADDDSYQKEIVVKGIPKSATGRRKKKEKPSKGGPGAAVASANKRGKQRSFLGGLFHRRRQQKSTEKQREEDKKEEESCRAV